MSMKIVRAIGAAAFAAALMAATPASAQPDPPPPPPLDEELAEPETEPAPEPRRARQRPRAEIRPYIEVNAAVSADLSGGDDEVLTYTSAAAGIDGRIATRRVTAAASYRYERRIALEGDLPDSDVHSGVAMVHAEAAPGVALDAGALAARTGGGGRTGILSEREPASQVYSAYAGPTLSTRVGPVSVGAAYRLGYVRVDHDDDLAGGPGGDRFDDAVAHNASASIGMGPGRLPFGWTVGAAYAREDSGEFDNRFEAMAVRGDIVVPVGPTLALTAGVGYDDIEASQQDVLRDEDGVPILVGGRLVADPTRPRLRGFDSSGIFYDGGIIWRPTPRTELQARAGRRYGGTTFTGSLRHRFNRGYGVSASVYDSVGTFGTTIINNISQLPTDFNVNRNPLTGALDGCVFGEDPGAGACFGQSLQTVTSATFRGRGANLLFSGSRGPWEFGVGAGYSHRRYFTLVSEDIDLLDAHTDQSVFLNAGLGRRLSRYSGISLDASANWFDSDRLAFDPVFSTGLTGSYYRNLFMERLQFHAALGLYHTDGGLIDRTSATGLLGLRYTF